jgi:hypothetical protein
MRWSRRITGACAGAAMFALGALPAQALGPGGGTTKQIQVVADGQGIAFGVRPTYDSGGANPLSLFIGYAEANASTPEPEADGQGSWYQLNIIETAAFRPPEECTPQKNFAATQQGLVDIQRWISAYVQSVAASLQGQQAPPSPTVPSVSHACTERFPGFAQSRYPATATIDEHATDDYLDKPTAAQTCREDPSSTQCGVYKQYWPAFRSSGGRFVRDGSFSATATSKPSQDSQAVLFGAGDGTFVSVGLSRSLANARVVGTTLIAEASQSLDHVCIMATAAGCTVEIDSMRQFARVEKPAGHKATIRKSTSIFGVHVGGVAVDLDSGDLPQSVDLGNSLQLKTVSTTHSCDSGDQEGQVYADTGGLLIFGKGSQGGGIMIGGACARARIETQTLEIPNFSDGLGIPGTSPLTINVPGAPGAGVIGKPVVRYGPPQIVSKEVTRVVFRQALVWRTALYWVSALGALALAAMLGFFFRRNRAVAPVVGFFDHFARQFLRG